MKSKSILYIIFSKRGFDTLRLPDVLTILFYPHSWLIYNRVFNKSNTTGVTCGWGSPYPSGAPEFTPAFSGVRVTRSLVFCVVFCRSLFVLFLLTIVLSVLRITASDYPFGVFKPHLPFPPSPLLNIFPLFVILSLTQLYRYTPEIFLFSTATFKYIYRASLRQIGQE